MNEHSMLDDLLEESDQYYSVHDFIRSSYRFQLLPIKIDVAIHKELTEAYGDELGLCGECDRTKARCRCSDDRDDEYDRYYDR